MLNGYNTGGVVATNSYSNDWAIAICKSRIKMFKTTETSQSGSDMQKKIRLIKCAKIKKQKNSSSPSVHPSIPSTRCPWRRASHLDISLLDNRNAGQLLRGTSGGKKSRSGMRQIEGNEEIKLTRCVSAALGWERSRVWGIIVEAGVGLLLQSGQDEDREREGNAELSRSSQGW